MISIPPSGVVEVAAHHLDVQEALREAGFVQPCNVAAAKPQDGGGAKVRRGQVAG